MKFSKFNLEKNTALITGGVGLLGIHHAKALLESGARVVITDIDESKLNSCKEDLLKDFKTQLQELLQKKGFSLPKYELLNTKGKDHNAVFYVSCHIEELKIMVEKNAKSIKRAEQACAQSILEEISAL